MEAKKPAHELMARRKFGARKNFCWHPLVLEYHARLENDIKHRYVFKAMGGETWRPNEKSNEI